MNCAPPSASRLPVPIAGDRITAKPRAAPRAMSGSTTSSRWPASSTSVPDAKASCGPHLGGLVLHLRDDLVDPVLDPLTGLLDEIQPTMLTTSAESRTVEATTRACTDRRQNVSARRRAYETRSIVC